MFLVIEIMEMPIYIPRNTLFFNNNVNADNIYEYFVCDILEIFKIMSSNVCVDHVYLKHYDSLSKAQHWRVVVMALFVKNIYVPNHVDVTENPIISHISKNTMLFFPYCFKFPSQKIQLTDSNLLVSSIDYINYMIHTPSSTHGQIKFINRRHDRTVYDYELKEPIENLLKTHGFECAYFEDMTPYEQIEFCRNARVMVSPHGAGLTNLIFTHSNCIVCEIQRKDEPESKYANLCRMLNRRYIRYDVDDVLPNAHEKHLNYLVLHLKLIKFVKNHLNNFITSNV